MELTDLLEIADKERQSRPPVTVRCCVAAGCVSSGSQAVLERLHGAVRDAGLTATVAEQDLCCHAVQDKVFVEAPDVPNGWWEFYAVTDDSPANPEGLTSSACEVACNAAQDASAGSVCCG